jgi:hypothetical protein
LLGEAGWHRADFVTMSDSNAVDQMEQTLTAANQFT